MGNQQPKKVSRPNKTQIDVGCLKAKIHLQMMRDRKNQEVIKGQKQLVAKIKSNSRNKTQQVLVAERVVNGLKYAGACNMLMAYANSLKGQSQFLCDSVGNREKLEPWLPMVYSLLYAAEHLGLSSLNQFKNAMRALNDPLAVDSYVNADVKQLLTPSPSPQELNIYILQMCQRNNIPLQQVNKIGHRFTKDIQRPPSIQNSEFNHMEQMLAQKFKQGFGGNQGQGFGNQGQGFGNQGQGFGNQGGNGGFGNYTGTYGNPQNMGCYGQGGQNQNTAGFTNPVNKQKTPIVTPTINPNPNPQYLNDNMHNNNLNPYKGLSNVRDQGPKFYQPSKINNNNINTEKPRQFSDFDDIINPKNNNEDMGPMYPSVDMSNMKYQPYKPNQYKGYQHQKKEDLFDQPQKPHNQPSPTISQLLRSLGK